MERGESEAHDRLKFCIHWCVSFFFESAAPTPKKTLCLPFVPLISFWGFGWAGVGGVLRCSTSPFRCRFGQVSLSCLSWVCVPCLNSQKFSSFALPMKAVAQTPAESKVSTHFGRSGRLYFLVCPPAHLHESVHLSVLPTAPLCPMLSNLSLFFPAVSPPSPLF
jgi:hypothetical protein